MGNIFLTEREVFSHDAAKRDRESTLHMRSCNIATEFVSAGLKAKNKNYLKSQEASDRHQQFMHLTSKIRMKTISII